MKIRQRLILLTSTLVMVSIGFTAFLIVKYVSAATVDREIAEMQSTISAKESVLRTLNERASQDILFALKNPVFETYFELPETKSGNAYKEGVLQFSERQTSVKAQLDNWIYHFQKKFTIDETCLIDLTGQEHSRLVLQRIEPPEHLSDHERNMPFFTPTFEKNKDEVHIQAPYFSPDTHRWVFAYASPIVLANGDKPAFFHFEMPVKLFQDLLNIDYGRMYVVDEKGFLIADSSSSYPNPLEARTYEEFFPNVATVFPSEDFSNLLRDMRKHKLGVDSYVQGGETHHVVFRTLEAFPWLLVYELPEATMMGRGDVSVRDLELVVLVIAIAVILGALISVFVISKRITDPITKLGVMARKLSEGARDTEVLVKGDDEIHDLADSFNSMAKAMKRTIELEKRLAIAEQKVKNEKLAAIGSLSAGIAHDIRNPLSTIKTTVDLLKENREKLAPKMAGQLVRLERAVDSMTIHVNSVLEFVRTRSLRMKKISSRDLIEGALGKISMPAGVTVDPPEDVFDVYCDREKMEDVITNLVVNAIEAVGEEGQIAIRVRQEKENLVLEIEDSGPGIPEEVLPRIFDVAFTTKEEGTGLGLFGCKAVVEQHGGTIWVRNEPTTFVIMLRAEISRVPAGQGEFGRVG